MCKNIQRQKSLEILRFVKDIPPNAYSKKNKKSPFVESSHTRNWKIGPSLKLPWIGKKLLGLWCHSSPNRWSTEGFLKPCTNHWPRRPLKWCRRCRCRFSCDRSRFESKEPGQMRHKLNLNHSKDMYIHRIFVHIDPKLVERYIAQHLVGGWATQLKHMLD